MSWLTRLFSAIEKQKRWDIAVLLLPLALLAGSLVATVEAGGIPLLEEEQIFTIPINKARTMNLVEPGARVSVGNPDIVDLVVLKDDELYLLGKQLGSTNLMFWGGDDELIDVVELEVTHDLNGLKERLYRFLPEEAIEVHTSQGDLVLAGQASNLELMNTAYELATSYTARATGVDPANSTVINMMTVGGGHQVMLEVLVAEVSRDLLRSMDAAFDIFHNGSHFSFGSTSAGAGQVSPSVLVNDEVTDSLESIFGDNSNGALLPPLQKLFEPFERVISDNGIFASYLGGDTWLDLTLDLAKQENLARVLAEPNLVALSGQKADFLAGGEFPVPVPNGEGETTIEYKEFGVGVSFVPYVLSSGKISTTVNLTVSEISNQNSVFIQPDTTNSLFVVPSLRKRAASSTVELADGQTLAIAGLIQERLQDSIEKYPGLGEIPVLGQLFNSKEFINNESELVILVTPRLVRPVTRDEISLPTDGFVKPTDVDFYLFGRPTQKVRGSLSPANPAGQAVAPAPAPAEEAINPLNSGGTEQKYGQSI